MGLNNLAEAIIFQSLEDLWDEGQKNDCIEFFRGDGFSICAEIAGIKALDQIKILNLIYGIIDYESRTIKTQRMERHIAYSCSRG